MKKESVSEARRFAELIEKFTDAFVSINYFLTLEETLNQICEKVRQIIGAHHSLTIVTSNQNWRQARYSVSHSDKYAPLAYDEELPDLSAIYDLVCLQNKPIRMTQRKLKMHPLSRDFAGIATNSPLLRGWLAAPIVSHEGTNMGLLLLSDKYKGGFSESDEAILVQLARMAAIVIEKVGLFEGEAKKEHLFQESEESLVHTTTVTQITDDQGTKALLENNRFPTFIYDPESFVFLAVNHAAIREYGYSVNEFLSLKLSDLQLAQNDLKNRYYDVAANTGHKLWKHRKKNGAIIEVEYNFQRVDFEGKQTILITLTQLSKPQQDNQSLDVELVLLRSLLNKLPGFIYAKDRESRFVFANPAVATSKGEKSPYDLIGRSDFDFYPPDLASQYFATEQEIMLTGQGILNLETRDRDENGKEIWTSNTKVPWLDGEGNVIGILGMNFDITERKLAEEALRESEQRYRKLFENNPHPMWFYDLETLAILAVNNAAVTHYGYTREEFLQLSVKDLSPPADVPGLVKDLTGFTTQIDLNSKRRHKKKDGTIIIVEVTSHDISFEGRSARLAMVNDLTERQRAEEERDRFFTVSLDMLCVAGFDGYFKRLNTVWEKNLGYTSDELMSKPYLELVHPEDRQQTIDQANNLSDGQKVMSFDNRYLCKNGTYRWLSWSATPYPEQQLIYAVAHDITERKKAEEALLKTEEHLRQTQKMDAIGRLAGGVAHDFNNLLTAVIGYSEVALKKVDFDNPVHDDILEIKKAGERAASLTSQLLAFGRKQMLQPKILDFNSVMENISKMLRRLIGEDIDIAVIPHSRLGLVKADPGHLEQVVVNLALNARDAMPNGGILTLETANVQLSDEYAFSHLEVTPGPYVMFAMTDTGIGMDVKTMARVFEPFFTTKDVGKGSGLGLAMVYGIIKQSGGHVAIYSEQGVGTTVKIYLPRIDEERSPQTRHIETAPLKNRDETILLVEDEEIVRDLTARILRDIGYEVLVASNGIEAMEIVDKNIEKIVLVISDIVMPQMGGKELMGKLMSLKPQLKMIFISGYTENSMYHQGLLNPNIAFLQKPFSYEAIASKVRGVLAQKD